MTPAIILTYLFGTVLLSTPGVVEFQRGWIWVKLAFVLLLTVFHMMLARWRRVFEQGGIPHSSRFFRIANEMPTLAMLAIVLLVVAKPF